MRLKLLNGILLLLSSIFFSACEKLPVPENEDVKWVEFGFGQTKGNQSFNWTRGDQICIYSLDANNAITYKYVATVTNSNGNTGKIKALVNKYATQYFATYPANAINCDVYTILDDEKFNVVYNGKYRDVSIMTSYVPTTAQDIWFEQRFSLLKITNILGSVDGKVTVESSCPTEINFKMSSFSEYYLPLSYKDEEITVIFKTANYKRTKTWNVTPGKIYVSEYTIN